MVYRLQQGAFDPNAKQTSTPVGDVLKGLLSRYGLTASFMHARLEEAWPELVGDAIARVTRLVGTERDTLVIAVSSSSWRQSLQLEQNALLEKIQTHPAGKQITKLKFLHDLHAFDLPKDQTSQ